MILCYVAHCVDILDSILLLVARWVSRIFPSHPLDIIDFPLRFSGTLSPCPRHARPFAFRGLTLMLEFTASPFWPYEWCNTIPVLQKRNWLLCYFHFVAILIWRLIAGVLEFGFVHRARKLWCFEQVSLYIYSLVGLNLLITCQDLVFPL